MLYPGAGGDRDHHTLAAIEAALAPMHVARRDFSYRQRRKGPPDRAPKLIDDVVSAIGAMKAEGHDGIVLGGRSMGGRIASMAVAEGLRASGLILLSYPLHAPGKPDRPRRAHFGDIDVPCLFVSGTKDPFGSPSELTDAAADIPGPVTMEWLDGEAHDPKRSDDRIAEIVRDWIDGL